MLDIQVKEDQLSRVLKAYPEHRQEIFDEAGKHAGNFLVGVMRRHLPRGKRKGSRALHKRYQRLTPTQVEKEQGIMALTGYRHPSVGHILEKGTKQRFNEAWAYRGIIQGSDLTTKVLNGTIREVNEIIALVASKAMTQFADKAKRRK